MAAITLSSPASIAAYNEVALHLLKEGEYKESHTILQISLGVLQNEIQVADQANSVSDLSTMKAPIKSTFIASKDIQSINEGVFAVFSRAFLIPDDTISVGSDGQATIKKDRIDDVTAILLFNTALIFHLKALSTGVMVRHNLVRALKVYNMAMSFQMGVERMGDGYSASLKMALLNNVGHIHELMVVNSDEAASCYASMAHLLSRVEVDEIEFDHFACLFSYIFVFPEWRTTPARAA